MKKHIKNFFSNQILYSVFSVLIYFFIINTTAYAATMVFIDGYCCDIDLHTVADLADPLVITPQDDNYIDTGWYIHQNGVGYKKYRCITRRISPLEFFDNILTVYEDETLCTSASPKAMLSESRCQTGEEIAYEYCECEEIDNQWFPNGSSQICGNATLHLAILAGNVPDGINADITIHHNPICEMILNTPSTRISDLCAEIGSGANCKDNGDDDNDGVLNHIDRCPNTPEGTAVNEWGCDSASDDDDGDGVINSKDNCPGTIPYVEVDAFGCALSDDDDRDSDGDGIPDKDDLEPDTPPGTPVDPQGRGIYPDPPIDPADPQPDYTNFFKSMVKWLQDISGKIPDLNDLFDSSKIHDSSQTQNLETYSFSDKFEATKTKFSDRATGFFDTIKGSDLFSLPELLIGDIPSGGQSNMNVSIGNWGSGSNKTINFNLSNYSAAWDTLKYVFMILTAFACLKILVLKQH